MSNEYVEYQPESKNADIPSTSVEVVEDVEVISAETTSQVFTEPAAEEVVAAEEPAPKVISKSTKRRLAASESSLEGVVSASVLTYRETRRNSASVAVLQDRLAELGYADARADLRGWFHDGTRRAVEAWQSDNGGAPVVEIFAGTSVEVVA